MSDFYKRQIQLWGEQTQKDLSQKSIAIIGCGGLGCSIALSLGSSGIKHIHLVDFDTITLDNIHRQIAFKLKDIKRDKCEVLGELLQARSSDVKVHLHKKTFEEFSQNAPKFDLIIDATDNLFVRQSIDKYAKKNDLPWCYASVEEFNGQVCLFEKASFSTLFKPQEYPSKGQTPPMVVQIASFASNLSLRYLANLSVKTDMLYFLYFDKNGEFKNQSFHVK